MTATIWAVLALLALLAVFAVFVVVVVIGIRISEKAIVGRRAREDA